MITGFCYEGMLSSLRVQGIIPAVVAAFEGAYAIGVREFVLPQDCHTPDSVEFADFPPHCQAGTSEADTIPELASLRSEEHTSELQSPDHLVCRLLLEKKKTI